MTKRRMLAMIIALVMCVSLCACSAEEQSKADIDSKTGTFIVVAEGDTGSYTDQTIMYDPDTMVMYTHLDGSYSGAMSVIYNSDGTFKLYSPDTEAKTFVVVAEGDTGSYTDQTIMYDPDTMVMYTHLDGSYSGAMSLIYNADGTLKLYSPEH